MLQVKMYKIIGGVQDMKMDFLATSTQDAWNITTDYYKRSGLIGRYYVEVENGETFQIN